MPSYTTLRDSSILISCLQIVAISFCFFFHVLLRNATCILGAILLVLIYIFTIITAGSGRLRLLKYCKWVLISTSILLIPMCFWMPLFATSYLELPTQIPSNFTKFFVTPRDRIPQFEKEAKERLGLQACCLVAFGVTTILSLMLSRMHQIQSDLKTKIEISTWQPRRVRQSRTWVLSTAAVGVFIAIGVILTLPDFLMPFCGFIGVCDFLIVMSLLWNGVSSLKFARLVLELLLAFYCTVFLASSTILCDLLSLSILGRTPKQSYAPIEKQMGAYFKREVIAASVIWLISGLAFTARILMHIKTVKLIKAKVSRKKSSVVIEANEGQ